MQSLSTPGTPAQGRVLVMGAAGMLGLAVCHVLQASGFVVDAYDRARFDALRDRVDNLPLAGARSVINAAGLINRRLGRVPDADFWRVNALFPRLLSDACARAGVPLVHISTDCVFNGTEAPHRESDRPDATDLYGMSKASGEPPGACVLRTSIIGPEWGRSDSLLCWFLNQQGPVQGYTHHLWNGVTTLELARVISLMLQEGADRQPGLRHIHGEDITKHDLLVLMSRVLAHPMQVQAAAPGPARDTRLATHHPHDLARWGVRSLEQQLMELAPLCGPAGQWKGDPPSADSALQQEDR
jgi:dTDP-4-dehydrorhamnose reductase